MGILLRYELIKQRSLLLLRPSRLLIFFSFRLISFLPFLIPIVPINLFIKLM